MSPVSIVVPVFNHWELTSRCLEALAADGWVGAREVVVVDDGSSDGTLEALAKLAGRYPGLRVVSNESNQGFAAACNRGAAEATGDLVVFLNNDTTPLPGWLDALTAYARNHPDAGAVGAKLLFPDGTVQHAGVVIGQDGNPHHLYVGFPADHPAVNRPRHLAAVTAACMLVRREAFESCGGFDTAFRNGHEDVDLCLRMGSAGWEVHYCPDTVVVHLESVTRGHRTAEAAANGRLYRQRWADAVPPDDIPHYVQDGLLRVEYEDGCLLRLSVDPQLATVDHGTPGALERQLRLRSRQVAELLEQTVRRETGGRHAGSSGTTTPVDDPEADDRVAEAVDLLQRALAAREGRSLPRSAAVAYRRQAARIRSAVLDCTPAGAVVAVAARGDDDLVDLAGRTGLHFPAGPDGRWTGYHPAGSQEALEFLDHALEAGATHLVIPAPSVWWLDQYPGLTRELTARHQRVRASEDCVVFRLARDGSRPREVPGNRLEQEVATLRCALERSQVELLRRFEEMRTAVTGRGAAPATAGTPAHLPLPAPAGLGSDAAGAREEETGEGPPPAGAGPASGGPMDPADYAVLVKRIRSLARTVLPVNSVVAVVSRGDDALVDLDGRIAWHFPRLEDGRWAGHHPGDSAEAIAHLERLHSRGAQYLLLPATARWWLSHYDDFRRHLEEKAVPLVRHDDACVIFALDRLGAR